MPWVLGIFTNVDFEESKKFVSVRNSKNQCFRDQWCRCESIVERSVCSFNSGVYDVLDKIPMIDNWMSMNDRSRSVLRISSESLRRIDKFRRNYELS